MSPPPRVAAWLLLILLAACAEARPEPPPVGSAPSDTETLALVARLPQENGGFLLEASLPPSGTPPVWAADYRHAESGTLARVIIALPAGEAVPPGPDSALVRSLTNAQALAIQAATGGSGLTRRPDFSAGLRNQPPEIRCADLQLRPGPGPSTRLLNCNTGINGRLVTIAMIGRHPAELGDKARLFMVRFAMLMTHALRGGDLPAPPPEPPPEGPLFRL